MVVTYDTNTNIHTVYVDGAYKTHAGPSASQNGGSGNQWVYIGSLLDGYIDDLRFYSRALSATEAQTRLPDQLLQL